jgi:flagellar hook-associated protein 1 FlgK
MSGLLSLLSQGATSLQATQAWSSVIAQNLANANTPGYTRQRADLTAMLPAERVGDSFLGRGVMLSGVVQLRDRFIESQFSAASGRQSASSSEMAVLQSVSVLDVNGGVGTALSGFYGALRALAQNPGSQSYREAAVGSAKELALAFNRTATALEAARTGVDQQVDGSLSEVNQAAAQVAQLNTQIRAASVGGASPNDLLDARQKLVDRLAVLTGATSVPNSEGSVNLVLPGGAALVTGSGSAILTTRPDPSNGGHLALFLAPPDKSPAVALQPPMGGQLGGALTARDGGLATALASLDQLASDLTTALNTVHQGGYALDGTTGHQLFVPSAAVAGAALAMQVDPAVGANVSLFSAASSAGAPGDATTLQALINTETQTLSSGTDVEGTLARLTSQYGATAHRAQAASEGDRAVLDNVTSLRQSASGVSVDEELVDMQKAQRAYEASSKVIKAADDMLNTLMSLR